jgi:hypothetical protein
MMTEELDEPVTPADEQVNADFYGYLIERYSLMSAHMRIVGRQVELMELVVPGRTVGTYFRCDDDHFEWGEL